jgi:hypothetical protein
MVRIINTEKAIQSEPVNTERSKVLLQLLAVLIADRPTAVIELLENYSVVVIDKSDKAIAEQLLAAIAECDPEFNEDLTNILFNCSLESSYDSFDFRSLFGQKGQSDSQEDSAGSQGGSGGGIFNGIANVVGSLGGTIGKVIQGRQAKDQATAQTLQNIYSYKAQLSAADQSKTKNKNMVFISLLVVLGIVLIAIAYANRQKTQQPLIQ